jgi:hypothetical protein
MPKTEKPRVRPRDGYVMVELSKDERKKLEAIRDRLSEQTGVKVGLAGAFRSLLRRAK